MDNPYNPYESGGQDGNSGIKVDFKRNRGSMKKSGIGTVNAGGAIIIIIFVVLCLTIFGLLSFSTAFADKKLADRNLQSVARYYAADSEAEEKLALIYDAVHSKIQTEKDADFDFNEDFVNSAFADSNITGETDVRQDLTEVIVSYTTDMSDIDGSSELKIKFYLSSKIELYYDKNLRVLSYKITEWKVVWDMDSEIEYGEDSHSLIDFEDWNW